VIDTWHLPLLFLTGLAAGFVDSIAGGGGLITIPVLLSFGLDPRQALATNKLQATFGSASAAFHYAHAGAVNWRECGRGFTITFIGAAAGTLTVRQVDALLLARLVPWLLAAVAAYMFFKPSLGEADRHARLSRGAFEFLFGLALGFYDGFFGPGTGTFWAMGYVLLLGYNLTRATAHTKVMNFSSNLASLLFFLPGGGVLILPGLVMGAGQLLGARLGSRMVLRKGTRFIRPIFLTVVLAFTARLLYLAYLQ
jgi:hypothetical protein